MSGFVSRLFMIAAALLLSIGVHAASPSSVEAEDSGPRQLFITYRSEAKDRPAFRDYLSHEGRAPFDKLVRDGALKDYQILFNPFNTSYTWDAMVVMEFAHYADTRRWNELERTSPGGLSAKGLTLARPVDTYAADLTWQGTASQAAGDDPVYYVIPYEYRSAAEYRKYIEFYVLPQVNGWMQDGALSSYRIYMNRYPVGKPWDSLFVFQYRDLDSFGRRDQVLAKVREGLKADPVWQKLNETKQGIRSESENTIAELLLPR